MKKILALLVAMTAFTACAQQAKTPSDNAEAPTVQAASTSASDILAGSAASAPASAPAGN